MEQRRVGRAQRQRDRGVALVPGRADRVEAPAGVLQVAGGEVAHPAADLSAPDRLGLGVAAAPGGQFAEALEQMCFEWVELHGQSLPARLC